MNKICSICKLLKSTSDFHVRSDYKHKTVSRCKSCNIDYLKQYRARNHNKLYEKRQLPENKAKVNSRAKDRYKNDPIYNLRARVSSKIRRMKSGLIGSTRYLPYNMNQLKINMELKFCPGMSWNNKHLWDIDHIIPLRFKNPDGSYYWDQKDLTNPASSTFKKAWGLDDLQPLWTYENKSKGNRRIG